MQIEIQKEVHLLERRVRWKIYHVMFEHTGISKINISKLNQISVIFRKTFTILNLERRLKTHNTRKDKSKVNWQQIHGLNKIHTSVSWIFRGSAQTAADLSVYVLRKNKLKNMLMTITIARYRILKNATNVKEERLVIMCGPELLANKQ